MQRSSSVLANVDDHIVEEGIAKLIRAGVTSVHHNNSWQDFLILRRLHQAGRLRLRVYASPPLPGWQRLRDYIAAYGRGDDWFHWGGVKGYGVITAERYYRWVSGASQAGLQVMVHTGANDELRTLLGVFERVRREQNLRDAALPCGARARHAGRRDSTHGRGGSDRQLAATASGARRPAHGSGTASAEESIPVPCFVERRGEDCLRHGFVAVGLGRDRAGWRR